MKDMKKRFKTRDVAFQYRMGAGFAGDVNRTHPAEIEAAQVDETNPATLYGMPCKLDATSHNARKFIAGDASDDTPTIAFGFIVRPYPVQASSGSNFGAASLGDATPPTSGPADFLRSGLIIAKLNSGAGTPVKGGTVYVWCAATEAGHTQGGLETEADTGNTVALDARYTFNGGKDADGVCEISVNV